MSISCDCCSLYMQKYLMLIMYKNIVSNLTSHISWPLPSFPVIARNASEMPRSFTFVTALSAITSCSQHYTAFKDFQHVLSSTRELLHPYLIFQEHNLFLPWQLFCLFFMRACEHVRVLLKMQKIMHLTKVFFTGYYFLPVSYWALWKSQRSSTEDLFCCCSHGRSQP